MSGALHVERLGFPALVQDLGRPGWAAIGVGRAGAADRGALRLANRLVGNASEAAGLEVVLGGLRLRAEGEVGLAVTGASCPVRVAGAPVGRGAPLHLHDGQVVELGTASAGLRAYVGVRGGLDVEPVLGSRSTDTLADLGPEALTEGTRLAIGPACGPWPGVDVAPVPAPEAGPVTLGVRLGPRADRFTEEACRLLAASSWTVGNDSDRVGLRLEGPELERSAGGELASEGMVAGALQVPPEGRPVLFGPDHPVTGGYPVIAVVLDADLDRAAQLRPGQQLRLRVLRG